MSKNLSELSGRKGIEDNLFDKMGKLAQSSGTLSSEALDKLAKEFLIGTANTYGTASFYDFLKPENKGKKVYVCNGTACLCAGTQDTVIDQLKTNFNVEEIGHMTCLGRCHENSAFHMNGKNYSGNSITEIDFDTPTSESKDKYAVKANGLAILTKPFTNIEEYYKPFLDALKRDSGDVLEEIKTSNVRGRGGAGLPLRSSPKC